MRVYYCRCHPHKCRELIEAARTGHANVARVKAGAVDIDFRPPADPCYRSEAVKAEIGMLRLAEGDVAVNEVTTGALPSISNLAMPSALVLPPASVNAPPAYRFSPLISITTTEPPALNGVALRADQDEPFHWAM